MGIPMMAEEILSRATPRKTAAPGPQFQPIRDGCPDVVEPCVIRRMHAAQQCVRCTYITSTMCSRTCRILEV